MPCLVRSVAVSAAVTEMTWECAEFPDDKPKMG
jgi:hypothetical protein